jgi:hypothetical protein
MVKHIVVSEKTNELFKQATLSYIQETKSTKATADTVIAIALTYYLERHNVKVV